MTTSSNPPITSIRMGAVLIWIHKLFRIPSSIVSRVLWVCLPCHGPETAMLRGKCIKDAVSGSPCPSHSYRLRRLCCILYNPAYQMCAKKWFCELGQSFSFFHFYLSLFVFIYLSLVFLCYSLRFLQYYFIIILFQLAVNAGVWVPRSIPSTTYVRTTYWLTINGSKWKAVYYWSNIGSVPQHFDAISNEFCAVWFSVRDPPYHDHSCSLRGRQS